MPCDSCIAKEADLATAARLVEELREQNEWALSPMRKEINDLAIERGAFWKRRAKAWKEGARKERMHEETEYAERRWWEGKAVDATWYARRWNALAKRKRRELKMMTCTWRALIDKIAELRAERDAHWRAAFSMLWPFVGLAMYGQDGDSYYFEQYMRGVR